LSPREFVELVELGNVEVLASRADISEERAGRIINHLTGQGTEAFLKADVEDAVTLELLDGVEYKPTDVLSVGQRCTVVLPILLAHQDQCLVVDQPEDNLDNAFIVDTVVKALAGRGTAAQSIFATHNANIPVLGDADKVFLMTSNGEWGTVDVEGPLASPSVVAAITEVMEGGREAFMRRAAFYSATQDGTNER
jgi:ABC-type sulfate/molybdate transport systems ATPase subunit